MNQTTRTCESCGEPNRSVDLICSRCGSELPTQGVHPEPFSVYPPPFSDAAPLDTPTIAQTPPIPAPIPEPEVVTPQPASAGDTGSLEPQTEVPPRSEPPPIQPVPSFIPREAGKPTSGAAEIASAASLLAGLNLPQDVFATIYSLTKQNLRIQAIVVLRNNTGLGLREAKDIVDRLAMLIGVPPARNAQCYIATACYGDAGHPDVVFLRRFRDEALLPTGWGRTLVSNYYALSPGIARRLGRNGRLAGLIRRRILEPLVRRMQRGSTGE